MKDFSKIITFLNLDSPFRYMVIIKPLNTTENEEDWDSKISSIKTAIDASFELFTATSSESQQEVKNRLAKLDEEFSHRVDNVENQVKGVREQVEDVQEDMSEVKKALEKQNLLMEKIFESLTDAK